MKRAIAVPSRGSILEPVSRSPLMPAPPLSSCSLLSRLNSPARRLARRRYGTRSPPSVHYNTRVTHFATPGRRGGAATPHYNAGLREPTSTPTHSTSCGAPPPAMTGRTRQGGPSPGVMLPRSPRADQMLELRSAGRRTSQARRTVGSGAPACRVADTRAIISTECPGAGEGLRQGGSAMTDEEIERIRRWLSMPETRIGPSGKREITALVEAYFNHELVS